MIIFNWLQNKFRINKVKYLKYDSLATLSRLYCGFCRYYLAKKSRRVAF